MGGSDDVGLVYEQVILIYDVCVYGYFYKLYIHVYITVHSGMKTEAVVRGRLCCTNILKILDCIYLRKKSLYSYCIIIYYLILHNYVHVC